MANLRTSRIFPVILTIIVIIVAIAGIVGLVRLLFTGSTAPSDAAPDQATIIQQNLLNTNDGRAVSMTVRGPIVADEDFRSYRITIAPNLRQIQTFTGYLDAQTDEQSFSNNVTAYTEFVYALNKANLVAGKQLEGEKNNLNGVCATGRVYEFNLLNAGTSDAMFWTSTCGGSKGSLRASVSQVSELFLNQIPNSSSITRSLNL